MNRCRNLLPVVMMMWTIALTTTALPFPLTDTAQQKHITPATATTIQNPNQPSGSVQLIGIVKSGKLEVLFPRNGQTRLMELTTIARQEARSPDSGALNLRQHVGLVIMVEGIPDSGWLYEAHIVDSGGPLLTMLSRILLETPQK